MRRTQGSFTGGALAAALALAACGGGRADVPESPRAMASAETARGGCPPGDSTLVREADIAIVATVRAEAVEHRERPRAGVSFPGAGARDTLSCDERRNLDRPVRPGRTYRDVEIRYRLGVRLDTTIARLLSADSARADTARRP